MKLILEYTSAQPNGSKLNKCITQVFAKSNNNDIVKQFPVR